MYKIEELLLIFLILLSISDFFEILPADLSYIKKIISWTALGYLLYKASLTKIFFNNSNKHIDLLLIISYFMLTLKNIILFSSEVLEEFVIFHDFQEFIIDNASFLEFYSLILGSVLILILAIYSAFSITVKKPSLMHIIHEEGKPNNLRKILERIIVTYLVYIAFFVIVFNLITEWLVMAIDAPLVMISILFYLFIVIRHYEKFDINHLIYKVGKSGEKFYEKFISMFHYKNTILLGISGMLVLHLLTDALSFVIHYILNFEETIYLSQLGQGHDALPSLFLEQVKNKLALEQFSLFFVYLLNTIGILSLLLLPSFLWYIAYTKNKFNIGKLKISLILTSIFVFFISPIFEIVRLTNKAILGVDIKTNLAKNMLFNDFFQVLFFALIFSLMIFFLQSYYKKQILHIIIIKTILFFMYYIYLFFTSLSLYFIEIIRLLFTTSTFILSFHFFIIFIITILFYLAGFIMFIDEIIKEKVYKKIS